VGGALVPDCWRRYRYFVYFVIFCSDYGPMSGETEQRRLAAIMFTDMVGYSALSQRDSKVAVELLEEHRELLRNFSKI